MSMFKKMMLAVSLFMMSGYATSATYNLDLSTGSDLNVVGVSSIGPFVDFFKFTLDQDLAVDLNLGSFGGFNSSLFQLQIVDVAVDPLAVLASAAGSPSMIDDFSATAGIEYTVNVLGGLEGGFGVYALGISTSPISPVPEANTLAMLLGGLGLVGFMARRRKVA